LIAYRLAPRTRVAAIAVTFGLVLAAVVILGHGFANGWAGWYGQDLAFYARATQRWIETGQWVLPRQLAGAYAIQPGDILYPPVTAPLFAPWLVLPAWTFVAIPVTATAVLVARMRPAAWAWPLLAACLVWPDTQVKVIAGNPGIWLALVMAYGLRLGWPTVLVLLKPSLFPFALFGARRRSWWVALGAVALVSLPFGALWVDWLTAVRNSNGGVLYSLADVPFVLIPLVAWLARAREGGVQTVSRSVAVEAVERGARLAV
jgi:hypothetical protein